MTGNPEPLDTWYTNGAGAREHAGEVLAAYDLADARERSAAVVAEVRTELGLAEDGS